MSGVPRRTICRLARLSPVAGPLVPEAVEAHAASCLRCQADAARRRSLRRELGAIRPLVTAAPPALETDVLAAIAVPSGDRRRVRLQTAAATAVTAAAATAITIVLRRRGHSPA